MWQIILGYERIYPKKNKRVIKRENFQSTFSKLKKKGLALNENGMWRITEAGIKYINKKINNPLLWRLFFKEEELSNNKKNLIVAFDIPERRKGHREWLRRELRFLGFEPIQKSVWFGPAPLPKKFIVALSKLDILTCIKFFESREKDIV